MDYYRVTYSPPGSQDKEWTTFAGANREEVYAKFKAGTIIRLESISEEEFFDHNEEFK